ncbi:hypothetical protein HanXRQr2_Chr14g0636411 [Helianthus annuus]|uniref:Uncharacterized protein n=1 Tax=Helianthus annuus TaxID=4232 RepID=A0A9K3H729_HELAN|nr:hypothetical protein HanXRQr2_Chr14g0636411 [Helianthus annuus]KAJ0839734.1 hypothetical protein HanPSC8_Chr14g0610361 [Helianthus annuus]
MFTSTKYDGFGSGIHEVTLLGDNEAVRITAAGKVTKFSCFLSPKLAVQNILPWVKGVCFIIFLYFSFSFLTFSY